MSALTLAKRLRTMPPSAFGGTVEEAIDATKAIVFAVSIDDHFERLDFLKLWVEGGWRQIRKDWPSIDTTGKAEND